MPLSVGPWQEGPRAPTVNHRITIVTVVSKMLFLLLPLQLVVDGASVMMSEGWRMKLVLETGFTNLWLCPKVDERLQVQPKRLIVSLYFESHLQSTGRVRS